MAIDSERKRKSAAMIGPPINAPVIVPDGTIAKEDRQTIGWGYYGITAASPGGFQVAWAKYANNLLVGGGYNV